MCMLFLYDDPGANPDEYCLVLASVRDEFLMRPSRQCHFWEKNPDIVGGMDFEHGREGGTWLGMNRSGKIAALLNVLKPMDDAYESRKTRGYLPVNYLTSNLDGPSYLADLAPESRQYDGFIMVTVDIKPSIGTCTSYFTNLDYPLRPIIARPGFHAFGNSLPDRPWKKVEGGKRRFARIVKQHRTVKTKESLLKELFKLMRDDKHYFPDEQLLKDGHGLDDEYLRRLSSIYVKMPDISFGSRTHSVILVDGRGNVDFIEKTMQEPVEDFEQDAWVNTRLRFAIPDYDGTGRRIGIPLSRL